MKQTKSYIILIPMNLSLTLVFGYLVDRRLKLIIEENLLAMEDKAQEVLRNY